MQGNNDAASACKRVKVYGAPRESNAYQQQRCTHHMSHHMRPSITNQQIGESANQRVRVTSRSPSQIGCEAHVGSQLAWAYPGRGRKRGTFSDSAGRPTKDEEGRRGTMHHAPCTMHHDVIMTYLVGCLAKLVGHHEGTLRLLDGAPGQVELVHWRSYTS